MSVNYSKFDKKHAWTQRQEDKHNVGTEVQRMVVIQAFVTSCANGASSKRMGKICKTFVMSVASTEREKFGRCLNVFKNKVKWQQTARNHWTHALPTRTPANHWPTLCVHDCFCCGSPFISSSLTSWFSGPFCCSCEPPLVSIG